MMKKLVTRGLTFLAVATFSIIFYSQTVSAHGYIEAPASRAYLGKLGVNKNTGQAAYEPQSIETDKGFPAIGPSDGLIPSGGIDAFSALNEQSDDRWYQHDVTNGTLDITWFLTAPHSTTKWHYYMTKQGWDPNQPIKRSDLELVAEFQDAGIPEKRVTQTVRIPENRDGYHVIIGIWDIQDTGNAFYQTIDVNVNGQAGGNEDTQAPSIPTELKADASFNRVSLAWSASTDNVGVKHYEILRDGQVIGESTTTKFDDLAVAEKTAYTYQIRAIDFAGNQSALSQKLTVKTSEKPAVDTEKPTVPTGLKAHMTTSNSTMLHWNAATDNVGVSHYEVYRDNQKVATTTSLMHTDKALKANTTYAYVVYAVDAAGNRSVASDVLKVTTLEAPIVPEKEWSADTIYNYGEEVTYKGLTYRAKWWTRDEVPGETDVWELLSTGVALDWYANKAYQGGEKVVLNGKTYEAKWWTKGENPQISSVWVEVK